MKEDLLFNIMTEKITDDYNIKSWILFLKSLNLKSDKYGWCELNLLEDKAEEHMAEIKQYCDKNNLLLKGFLDLDEDLFESEWYKVKLANISDDICDESVSTVAYKVPGLPFIEVTELCIVSEDIYNIVNEYHLKGIRFCWITDKGKYASKQFFTVIVDYMVPYVFSCKRNVYEWNDEDFRLLDKYSDNSKFASKFIYDLSVNSPVYIPACNNDSGFMYYNWSYAGQKELLINKQIVGILIEKNICRADDFTPVKTSNVCPEGYRVYQSSPISFVSEDVIKEHEIKYNRYKKEKRPEFKPEQENTLLLLKKAKVRHNKYYSKGLSKAETEKLSEGEYSILISYYQVCNGGFLSGEYEFYSHTKSVEQTIRYKSLSDETLSDKILPGIVIGGATDGDYIVMYEESIYRVSHEDFNVLHRWDNIHSFIYQALSNN